MKHKIMFHRIRKFPMSFLAAEVRVAIKRHVKQKSKRNAGDPKDGWSRRGAKSSATESEDHSILMMHFADEALSE